jgi:hypothetical protein
LFFRRRPVKDRVHQQAAFTAANYHEVLAAPDWGPFPHSKVVLAFLHASQHLPDFRGEL